MKLEENSVLKYLVAGKFKQCKNHKIMNDIYGENILEKNLYKWSKHEFAPTSLK